MKANSEIKAIFFDLDGTLLPLDQGYYLKQYFKRISAYAASLGVDPERFMNGMMVGTEAMLRNNGEQTNSDAFWHGFFDTIGIVDEEIITELDKFYVGEFKNLKEFTAPNPLAVDIIKAAHNNGRKVVLATNPVFPMVAQLERAAWVGLTEHDFDHVTAYDNSRYCKPNPAYYFEICEKLGVEPENCLMIGNDESDDMRGASAAGMQCFLVTDHRIMADNFVWTGERGSFEQALHLIERI